MRLQFLEKKQMSFIIPSSSCGSFALDRTPIRFHTCRELFAVQFNDKTKGFFYRIPALDKSYEKSFRSIATFITKTEQILGLNERTKFAPTCQESLIWIEPNPFWKETKCKRSFFTALLRSSFKYSIDEDNYEKSLFSRRYFKYTKRAVFRFMFGFTDYVGPELGGSSDLESRGWMETFRGLTEHQVKLYLVKKDSVKSRLTTFSSSKDLWL